MTYCSNCGKALPAGAAVCPGCGQAPGPRTEGEGPGEGRVSFARLSSMSAKLLKTSVIIDGRPVAKLREKQSFSAALPFGEHSLTLKIPLNPSYQTSFIVDEDHRNVRCFFAANVRSGRPEPVKVEAPDRTEGVFYLEPDPRPIPRRETAKTDTVKKEEKSVEKSIYQTILDNLQNGELPEDFVIERAERRRTQFKFVPGAIDGILLYHTTPYIADEETKQQILQALTLISAKDNSEHVPQILGIFEKLEDRASMVKLYDSVRDVMLENIQALDAEQLLKFGDYLISYGTSFLAVKLGLTLLSIFNDKVPFVEEVHLTFGAYDEFTWFAARYLSSGACKDGNAALFELARHVHGWGRIHAVDYLLPETEEIRDWLLFEGAENTIMPQYSADLCLLKAGALDRLNGDVSEKEFSAIGSLLVYALDGEGPCRGVSDSRLVLAYLRAAERFPLNRALIQSIRDWSERIEMDEAAALAEQLLRA